MGNAIAEGKIYDIPLLPLRGMIVFPFSVVNFDVGREKSLLALEEAMVRNQMIFLATQKNAGSTDPDKDDINTVGTIAEIKQLLKLPGGTYRVLVEGKSRAKLVEFLEESRFYSVNVQEVSSMEGKLHEIEALKRGLLKSFENYVKLGKKLPIDTMNTITNVEDAGQLADIITANLLIKLEEKQKILECIDIIDRLSFLNELLGNELEIIELERKISVNVRKQMEKSQKEYYLREQLKAIQRELGDKDEKLTESEELKAKLKEAKLPKQYHEKIEKEISRLEKMPPMSSEAVVVRNYLDWVFNLPWSANTKDRLDLTIAEKILEEDHYGLKNVKERILEYLAVQKLTKKTRGPILCLVGPPGVGKTSLARSIARSMKRSFTRISLGGVRDEAEIRGHRRTYIGSMPGRIIQGMKNAGSKNPVFLLDEIDKMSTDFRGDPSAALLEVLDPEQNNSFSDHYIELPFDLSGVMFLTTANAQHNIPRPLLDRMEVIYISGYTDYEKVHIAKKYLIPKQLDEHGLSSKNISISDNALNKVIHEYTREAGVRNLNRQIANICRKSAREIVQNGKKAIIVNTSNLEKFLGVSKFHLGTAEHEHQIGVATGLAWTAAGGDVLPIEVSIVHGRGKLTMTGQLGDIMQESAQAGLSYLRSRGYDFNITKDFFEKKDIHIHVPEGAIPKDGPSAGITITTALASALTSVPVRSDVAMTGEITLRGRVLPIGGVKEKVLAAYRSGIKTVILPSDNAKDTKEIPDEVVKKMEFAYVASMDEVLNIALVGKE